MSPKELLQLVEAAIIAKGLSPSRFGRDAAGDASLVFQMRAGRELRHETEARVLKFINRKTVAA
jgi:homoserine dehydrogenase